MTIQAQIWLALLLALGACSGNTANERERSGLLLDAEPPALAACPESPNCVSSQAKDLDHKVEPLPLRGDVPGSMERLRRIIERSGRSEIVRADGAILIAIYRSSFFGFIDDVTFLFDAKAGVIHCRSASRVGYSDFGVNRERIEKLRADYRAEP